jgi:carboxymethylenebutenolidase
MAPKLACPWIGFFGDQDKGIPIEEVELLREATTSLSVPTEITRYADAGHGFNSDPRDDYNPEAAKDAYAKTLKLFAEKLTDK